MTSGTWERPEPPVVKFMNQVRSDRGEDIMVLDVGPGRSGRHSRLIEEMGLGLISVDVSHACRAHYHVKNGIAEVPFQAETFDIILDIKTLCQDPVPPYNLLWSWLKPGGYLFAMMPTSEHLTRQDAFDIQHRSGYDYAYLRCATAQEVGELLSMFSSVFTYNFVEPIRIGQEVKYLFSWCVEAQK